MFRHVGNCYVIMPKHVAGIAPKVTLFTTAPLVSDQATVQSPFWPDIDLSVGFVDRGDLDERCTEALDALAPTNASRSARTGLLLRVTPVGEEDRLPVDILERTYLTFTARHSDTITSITQGTSGAFVFASEKPIGMAITSKDPSQGLFIRSEEIAVHLKRYLSEQSGAFTARDSPSTQRTENGGVEIRNWTSNTPPILPQHAPENLGGDGLWVVLPDGTLELTLQLTGSDPTAISRLRIISPNESGYAVPKQITVHFDPSTNGGRFRYWTQGQMRPDGVFDTGLLAGRNARWVKISISSAWSEGPIALEKLILR